MKIQKWKPRGWMPLFTSLGEKGLYTTCVGCHCLLRFEDGPRCQGCQFRVDARKRMWRRKRKLWKQVPVGVEMGRHQPTSSPSEPEAGTATGTHSGLSKATATRQGPSGTSGSRSAKAAFGGQDTPQRRIPR